MRKVTRTAAPESRLDRILHGLELELVAASDGELVEAAKDLRMNPALKGSALYIGLKFPAKVRPADFFDFDSDFMRLLETDPRAALRALRRKAEARSERLPGIRKHTSEE